MFAMFLHNAKLFILYYYIKSLQVVDGGSHNDNHPLKFISFPNHLQSPHYVEQRSNTTAKFSDSTPETQVPKRQREGRMWIHTFQIPSDWAKYLPNRRRSTRQGSQGNLTKPFQNVRKQSNGQTIDRSEQFQPTQEKLEFRNSPNSVAWSRDLQSSIYEEQKLRTTARLSSLPPPTQEQIKEPGEKMWIRPFQILPVWSRNRRNGGQRFSTRQNLSNIGNLTSLFKVTGNNSGTRTPSNNNLPRIVSIPTLSLWSGENETGPSTYIRYNRNNAPKSEYEANNFNHIREPSRIGGSRQGMAGLSGLEGDHTNIYSSTLMSNETITNPSEGRRQKQWIRYSPNHPGWSENIPNYGNTNKNLNTTIKPLSLHPQTELMGQIKWFVYSPILPAWSGNEPNFGYIQQRLDTRSQGSHGSNESSEDPRAFTRPFEVSKKVNHESNTETDQKPQIRSGGNNLMSPQIQTRRVRDGRDISGVYEQELVEVEENSDNDPSLPVFIPV